MTVFSLKIQRIGWFGPADGCFAWMRTKLLNAGVREIVELHDIEQLLSGTDCHRIVLACRNRIAYPWQLIRSLQENSVVTPWAMAVDSWWEGARRTGIGVVGHMVLPWYRWWDGWHAWLFPRIDAERQFGTLPFSPVHVPHDLVCGDCVAQTNRGRTRLSVIAGCEQTASAWIGQARLIGMHATHVQPSEITTRLARADGAHRLTFSETILLDDTSLGTFPVKTFAERVAEMVRLCCEVLPGCPVIVAASFPRWDDWLLWHGCGASDLIAKPTCGLPLARIS